MLKSLEVRYKPAYKEEYELYKREVAETIELFESSKLRLNLESWKTASIKVVPKKVYYQKDYQNIIFDENECRTLKKGEEKPAGLLTMADGGTIPCALLPVLKTFKDLKKLTLEELGKDIVENGYRIHGKGVLHSVMDILLPFKYGVCTNLIEDVQNINDALAEGLPVFALVSSSYFCESGTGNQAVVIIRYKEGKFDIITPSERKILTKDAKEMIQNTTKAWIIGKK